MDVIYYISGGLMIPTFIGLIVVLIYFLIRPHHLQKSKHINSPVTRKTILLVGVASLFVAFVGFGSVLAATEPAGVKQARIEREAAEAKAEQAAQDKAAKKKVDEQVQVQREDDTKKPVIKTETKSEAVAFKSTRHDDSTLAKGQIRVDTKGVNGERTVTYEVTYVEGKEADRKVVKNETTKEPVNEVKAVGTYVYVAPAPKSTPTPAPKPAPHPSNCNPNYSGCVPNASDVDCAGGSGNGPAYVSGPVRVIGSDIYDLDRDGNGWGCE
jgi:hypothetical protein